MERNVSNNIPGKLSVAQSDSKGMLAITSWNFHYVAMHGENEEFVSNNGFGEVRFHWSLSQRKVC
jgi:hypothetical protein